MLRVLEPLDLRAAAALALAYFAALRPCEIRGLTWADYDGIEPLRGCSSGCGCSKAHWQRPTPRSSQNENRKPISLDSLNYRIIKPSVEKAGIAWAGFYPARRGISSLVTDTSKNALNSTGLVRHSTPITALRHYTRAQKDSIRAALEAVEQMATAKETVQ